MLYNLGVDFLETRAILDELQDLLQIRRHAGLGFLDIDRAQRLEHHLLSTLVERLGEIFRLLRREQDRDLDLVARVDSGEDLEAAPDASDVEGCVPRAHHRQDVADLLNPLPEDLLELFERDRLSLGLRLLHAVLVDASEAHPDPNLFHVQAVLRAEPLKSVFDLFQLVAPSVRQHVRSVPRVWVVCHIDVGGPLLAIARALGICALLADAGLDVVDLALVVRAQVVHELVDDEPHAQGSVLVPASSFLTAGLGSSFLAAELAHRIHAAAGDALADGLQRERAPTGAVLDHLSLDNS
mmetsp:Transcript_63337/g.87486  ORF Transcript_63337/g.87486 Transcript_63337/m.87486 type:complete len:297 (+) Transcript_63337:1032-1922(+)